MALDCTILQKKLSIPRIGVDVLWRNRLIEKLNEHKDAKVTIILAPTGYGKTVLISQYASIERRLLYGIS